MQGVGDSSESPSSTQRRQAAMDRRVAPKGRAGQGSQHLNSLASLQRCVALILRLHRVEVSSGARCLRSGRLVHESHPPCTRYFQRAACNFAQVAIFDTRHLKALFCALNPGLQASIRRLLQK